MFERYTEHARRVLFFARYEASQFGNPSIAPEHLLLGLLKGERGRTIRLFAGADVSRDGLRDEVVARMTSGERIPTSVEIPFEQATKRILEFAAQEADGLHHGHIGAEHLLLGILREEKTAAAEILVADGLRLWTVRQQIVESLKEHGSQVTHAAPGVAPGTLLGSQAPEYFFTHGIHLKALLGQALRVNMRRLELPASLDRTFSVTRERRQVDVLFVLGALRGRKPTADADGRAGGVIMGSVAFSVSNGLDQGARHPQEEKPPASYGPLLASGMTMAELVGMLEEIVGLPVIDETELDGRHDIKVSGPHDSLDAFRAAFERETGLTLTPATREIEVVVVR